MNIHEYQAKQLFREYQIPVSEGYPAFNMDDVNQIIDEHFPDGNVVIKAQIHAGGRGKAGGVKIANNKQEALQYAKDMFGMLLVTKQTGKEGKIVKKLYLEAKFKHNNEYYLSCLIDNKEGKVVFVASNRGGMSIEEIAESNPEEIKKMFIEPSMGFNETDAYKLANELNYNEKTSKNFVELLSNMYRLFIEKDCSLVEVNPFTIEDDEILCLDAKVNLDSGAFFRHPENLELRDIEEENPLEQEASDAGMSYVSLGGNIGCIANGAGLGMSSMDTINYYGGHPANFLDLGGSVDAPRANKAFKLVTKEKGVKGIVVNIFGGIARTNLIAEGIVTAIDELDYKGPVVCRLEGNNSELAKEIISQSKGNIYSADSCSEACQKMIELLGEAK